MALRLSTTAEVDPISRIEGHLGVKVTTDGTGHITDARAHGNLWRGFENFLLGRDANDAITFVQRICGVCPVPHGLTSTYAVDTVLGYSAGHITFAYDGTNGVPKKAVHIRNLVLGAEFLMSSLTHQYHLAAPSYIQGPGIPPWTPFYANEHYHPLLVNAGAKAAPTKAIDGTFPDDLWSAVIKSYVKALRARRLTFEAGAMFAGRMPMTSCYVGGGVTNYWTPAELVTRCDKFKAIMEEVGKFIIQEYVPIFLALGALYPHFDNTANATTLNGLGSLTIKAGTVNLWAVANEENTVAPSTTNSGYGKGLGRFLSWGAFPSATDTTSGAPLFIPGGVYDANASGNNFTVSTKAEVASTFIASGGVPAKLTESIKYARYGASSLDTSLYAGSGEAAYPGSVSRTKPNRAKAGAYTYIKAPRWNGLACEVGPLARMTVKGVYKVDGTILASTGLFNPYVKGSGLNPAMIHPDVAVGLLREGLATLYSGGNTYTYSDVATSGTTAGTIASLYTAADAEIRGIIYTWITNIAGGLSTMDRLRARALESLVLVQEMIGAFTPGSDFTGGTWGSGWIDSLKGMANDGTGFWRDKIIPTGVKQGWGGTEAPRGALMHQMTINNGKITKYQCIVPTTWNASPMDADGNHGALEQACIGAPFSSRGASFTPAAGGAAVTSEGGVEVLRIAQSFDPCIACAVH